MPETTCSIDGCDKIAHTRTWCRTHYSRWQRHGDLDYRRPGPISLEARLARLTNQTDSCWLWLGRPNNRGYGMIMLGGRGPERKNVLAHRLSYEIRVGPIPDGLVIDHLCRVRLCVNPAHLRAVTQRENLLAPGSETKSAINARKTHCPQGHAYTPTNIYWHDGSRSCRACWADRKARHQAP